MAVEAPGTKAMTEAEGAKAFEGFLASEEEGTETPAGDAEEETAEAGESEEADGEEEDGTEPDPDQADDEEEVTEEDDDEEAEPDLHEVVVNGKAEKVPLEELKRGYSRQKDYTVKTQAVAAQKSALEAEAVAVKAERDKYAGVLARLEEHLENQMPKEPDWAKLQAEDPEAFAPTFAAWQTNQKQLETVRAERAAVAKQQGEATLKQMNEALKVEAARLLERMPKWNDKKVAKVEKTAMIEYAKKRGFTDEDLAGLTDHRAVLLLHDAWKWHEAKQKTGKPKAKKAAGVLQPGPSAQGKKVVGEVKRAKDRLAKTGSREAFAEALLSTKYLDD